MVRRCLYLPDRLLKMKTADISKLNGKMAALSEMILAGLIEKDTNGDVLWTWSYPAVSEEQRSLFMRKCKLFSSSDVSVPFLYSQLVRSWYYIYTTDTDETDALPRVQSFSLILYAKDFNPEKYEVLCRIFSKLYRRTGTPAAMLEAYLSVVTRGHCDTEENGKFSIKDFDAQQSYANSSLRSIVELFGLESILIYTALLLKKRVVVYFPPHFLSDLIQFTRSLPAFVWHRQNWSIVYPCVELVDCELDELKTISSYVAGFTDATVESRADLYDVFVNGTAGQITVAQHAKEALAMGKLHKDIALAMVRCTEDSSLDDQQIIKEISNKTKELLNNLKSLGTQDREGKIHVTLEALKERKMPPATENFLFTLAACEGLVKL